MTWVYYGSPELDAQSEYPTIIAVTCVFTCFMLIAISTRIWLRRKVLGLDDYVILVTALFALSYAIQTIIQTRWGLGLPPKVRPHQATSTFTKLSYAGKPFYILGIAGFKLALCISYLRLTAGASKPLLRRIIIGIATFSTCAHVGFALACLFSCMPMSKNFDPNILGYCISFGPFNYAMISVTITCDVIIFLLPIPIFMPLQVDNRTKIGLICLFTLGLSTTVCSIVRATYLWRVVTENDNSMVVLVGAVEFDVGTTSCCLPFLRPLFFASRHGRSGYKSSASRDGVKNSYDLSNLSTDQSSRLGRSCGIPGTKFGEAPDLERSDSSEHILADRSSTGRNMGITKTVDYEVTSA